MFGVVAATITPCAYAFLLVPTFPGMKICFQVHIFSKTLNFLLPPFAIGLTCFGLMFAYSRTVVSFNLIFSMLGIREFNIDGN
jgi:hypothetical protein